MKFKIDVPCSILRDGLKMLSPRAKARGPNLTLSFLSKLGPPAFAGATSFLFVWPPYLPTPGPIHRIPPPP